MRLEGLENRAQFTMTLLSSAVSTTAVSHAPIRSCVHILLLPYTTSYMKSWFGDDIFLFLMPFVTIDSMALRNHGVESVENAWKDFIP